MNLTKVLMFPTSPTIAKTVGEIGFWIGATIMVVFVIAIVAQKTQTKLPAIPKDRPWIFTRK